MYSVFLKGGEGLWEVLIQAGGRKGIVYVDYSKKNFFSGAIINIKEKNNLTQESFDQQNKVDVSKIPLGDALVLGDKNAKYKVIVFSDPDCPYCSKLHAELKKVVEREGHLLFHQTLPSPHAQGLRMESQEHYLQKVLASSRGQL